MEPFVLAAWRQFRNGVLDQALLHAGPTTKAPTMARLEAAHASAVERLETSRRKLVAGKAGGRVGAASGASVPVPVPAAAGSESVAADAPLVAEGSPGVAVVMEDGDDNTGDPTPEGAGHKRRRAASADSRLP